MHLSHRDLFQPGDGLGAIKIDPRTIKGGVGGFVAAVKKAKAAQKKAAKAKKQKKLPPPPTVRPRPNIVPVTDMRHMPVLKPNVPTDSTSYPTGSSPVSAGGPTVGPSVPADVPSDIMESSPTGTATSSFSMSGLALGLGLLAVVILSSRKKRK